VLATINAPAFWGNIFDGMRESIDGRLLGYLRFFLLFVYCAILLASLWLLWLAPRAIVFFVEFCVRVHSSRTSMRLWTSHLDSSPDEDEILSQGDDLFLFLELFCFTSNLRGLLMMILSVIGFLLGYFLTPDFFPNGLSRKDDIPLPQRTLHLVCFNFALETVIKAFVTITAHVLKLFTPPDPQAPKRSAIRILSLALPIFWEDLWEGDGYLWLKKAIRRLFLQRTDRDRERSSTTDQAQAHPLRDNIRNENTNLEAELIPREFLDNSGVIDPSDGSDSHANRSSLRFSFRKRIWECWKFAGTRTPATPRLPRWFYAQGRERGVRDREIDAQDDEDLLALQDLASPTSMDGRYLDEYNDEDLV